MNTLLFTQYGVIIIIIILCQTKHHLSWGIQTFDDNIFWKNSLLSVVSAGTYEQQSQKVYKP